MRRRTTGLLLGLVLAATTPARSQVVQITEIDPDGGRHTLDVAGGGSIVDINSQLEFSLDHGGLTAAIGDQAGLASPRLSAQIKSVTALQDVVARGMGVLPRLARALAGQRFGADVTDSVRAVNRDLAPLLRAVSDAFPPGGDGARERINTALLAAAGRSGGFISRYQAVLQQAAQEVARLRLELNDLAREEGLYVQFGGWLSSSQGTLPIHLEGFDNHPDQEPYDVERWDFNLSDADRKELAGYQDFALEYRNSEQSLGAVVWAQARRSLASQATIDACLTRIEDALDGLQVTAEVSAARDAAASLRDQLEAWRALATGEHAGPDGLAVLTSFDKSSRALVTGTRQMLDDLAATADALPAAATADKSRLNAVLAGCRADLQELLADESQGLGRLFALVKSTRAVSQASLEFADAVRRHDLGSVPTHTRLALRDTGVRAEGDLLSFKLAVGRAGQPAVTLQNVQLPLYRVALFVTTAPVLIYAQPNHANRFKAAPAYSAVLAKGSRRGRLYNQLWRPGLGVNVSLLDFDNDDNLELGLAGVATLLRDLVQVGYGLNLNQNRGYWFLGLRLPMPGGAL